MTNRVYEHTGGQEYSHKNLILHKLFLNAEDAPLSCLAYGEACENSKGGRIRDELGEVYLSAINAIARLLRASENETKSWDSLVSLKTTTPESLVYTALYTEGTGMVYTYDEATEQFVLRSIYRTIEDKNTGDAILFVKNRHGATVLAVLPAVDIINHEKLSTELVETVLKLLVEGSWQQAEVV